MPKMRMEKLASISPALRAKRRGKRPTGRRDDDDAMDESRKQPGTQQPNTDDTPDGTSLRANGMLETLTCPKTQIRKLASISPALRAKKGV